MSSKTLFALPYILVVWECLINTVGFGSTSLKKDEGLCLFSNWNMEAWEN